MSSDDQERDPFSTFLRDSYKLLAVWPGMSDALIIQFAEEVYSITMSKSDVKHIKEACGLKNPKFIKLGRTIIAWRLAKELSTFGFRGRTKDKLVMSCVEACEHIIHDKISPLLISEWVEDIYEELSPYSNQPIQIRLYCNDKAVELQELLQCDTLPKIPLKG